MNAIVKVYRGCLDSIELYADEEKAKKRYEKILEAYDLTKDSMADSDYDIQLETNLKLQDISQASRILDKALQRVQEFSYKDWDASRVERLIINLKKLLQ